MKTNAAGRKIIIDFEGIKTESYPDPGSALARELLKPAGKRTPNWMCLPGDPWTIGIGATGPGIGPGLKWTIEEIWARFEQDLKNREGLVKKYVSASLNENQFSALVSFFFNVKLNSILKSGPNGGLCTLLLKLNSGDYLGAAAEFERWDNACNPRGCVEMPGLVRRRLAEQALFLSLANIVKDVA